MINEIKYFIFDITFFIKYDEYNNVFLFKFNFLNI